MRPFWLPALICAPFLVLQPAMAEQAGGVRSLVPAPIVPNPPSVEFGELFRAVQMAQIYPDQKTFADAIPKTSPAEIVADYERHRNDTDFNLKGFVDAHFGMPVLKSVTYETKPGESVSDYVSAMWSLLERQPVEPEPFSSLLPLARPYVVPGGRFSEIYYWDTFFTMLGLEQDGRHDIVLNMVKNQASLIDRYRHVPNGNRSYYLSRSQPPFFSAMVELVGERDGPGVATTYLPEMQAEYDYWMDGAESLLPGTAHRHAVRLADGTLLNRYWDDRDVPRDESYRQDVETAARSARPAAEVYRELRAGAESGWDFSSRWFATGNDLASIRTTAIAPVDLNSLMVHLEQMLAKAYASKGDAVSAARFERLAAGRAEAIRRLMWDEQAGLFTDYLWAEGQQTHRESAATVYPLYFRIASAEQAHATATTVRRDLLRPGGLATTLQQSGQQWDKPNGWAPLQYLAVEGLKHYGESDTAAEIAGRWIRRTTEAFERTGTLVEKYDVESPTGGPGGGRGGEYALQVGFGWTNGVLITLMHDFPDAATQPPKRLEP